MPTTRKNVRDYLKMAGWVLLSLFIAVISIFFLIPAIVLFWAAWFITDYYSKIGWIALGMLSIFLAYEAYQFIKRARTVKGSGLTFDITDK